MIDLRHVDCMEYLATCEDNAFELAIVDPPYGIGAGKVGTIGKRKGQVVHTKYKPKQWDNAVPTEIYFQELQRVSIHQIIWGANYFGHKFDRYIVWDKLIGDNNFSMAEIASVSIDKPTKIFKGFCGANRNGKHTTRIHPTQKPVKLYEWLLMNYAKEGDRILDTHLGSGSIAIACYNLGFDLVGCELDEDYYKGACERLERHKAQLRMF
jgi:site-specific DNA-methyltransferase (adenine-specific)